ncbi:MAG TPA: Wzz/FepE/Etk N-terminal domain-containing protein [Verrucomicrobiae bacterium]|nr:Wzz/FepE/Etk N-terminal domain-containing protein [Verrucomicrobiae bacterium]
MRQLFRDQCRDAWNESRNRGLLKLWLRVLPDLASSSIMERFAALNKRKTMTEKLASVSTVGAGPKIVFALVFAAVFFLTLILAIAITFILPESYASTARMLVRSTATSSSQGPTYDPYFIQTTLEIINSPVVLNPVIDSLNLNKTWGEKYFNDEVLKSSKTIEILKQRIQLAPVRNTSLIAITVYSDDREEAAQIANAIAGAYRDYRTATYDGPKSLPQPVLVQITDPAEPGRAPVKPNKPLNIVIGGMFGVFLGLLAGSFSAFITFKLGNSRRKTTATM